MRIMPMIRNTLALLACAAGAFAAPATPSPSKPNILFILTDDQGYGDISAHGNPILKTPHLDRLHAESVRFTDFHVSPTCAPTRSALLTGRHEFKNGVTHTIFERERMTLNATTIAQVLKGAGYTTGIFGKWHLGDEDDYQPGRRGYDEVFIHGGGGIGQIYPGSCGDAPGNTYFNPAIRHNGKFVKTEGYCTDVFFAQATKWIDGVKGRQPFFATIALNAPHLPLQVRPEDEARYTGKTPDEATAKYFGMVANIDDNIGRLLDHVRARGLEQNTLVIFMNDNGGTGGVRVFNAGMRGQKNSPWLGGTRAASFWRWPGRFKPADVPALTAHVDFFPTLAELAGVPVRAGTPLAAQVEGRSLVPLLTATTADWAERTLVTHVGRWPRFSDPDEAKFTGCAVRTPQWHLVSLRGGRTAAWELFDLRADPGEKNNLAGQHADVVARLAAEYDLWWKSVRPAMINESAIGPKQNPFKAAYWQQFGGGPTEEERHIMEPSHREVPGKKKKQD
jgi:arylsulfatase A-like enzyme